MIDIFYDDIRVAGIDVAQGGTELRYDARWVGRRNAFPISLSIPLGPEPVGAARILPWLANLLPESHLSEIGQQLGVSPQDILGLLGRIGRDTAGALAIGAPRPKGDEFRPVETDADLEKIINELPRKPFLVGEDGISMSLAGVQDKLPIMEVDGKIAIPVNGSPSTHILKPDSRNLPSSVRNEALCLKLAELVGLDVAKATTGRVGQRSYLLVERYDRHRAGGRIVRTHQEDFCQLLGYFPSAKYESTAAVADGGPSLVKLFEGAAKLIQPGARIPLLDAVIFNVLICNVDSHAKNYSILIGAGGTAKLAPLYDLMCGAVYPKITTHLPQAINGRREGAAVHGSDWRQLATQIALRPSVTVERVEELANMTLERADDAKDIIAASPAGTSQILGQIVVEIKKRCRRILRQLAN
jgi:serine/threonine-protein kinase HipA